MPVSIAYIGGTFDLLHGGHVNLFRRAKDMHDTVVVSVNADAFVERFKRRPIMNLKERMEMVRSCKYVDFVMVNIGDEDSKPAVVASGATHFVHGSDWTGDSLMRQLGFTEEWLREQGVKMVFYPYTEGISTGEIIKRIRG